MNAKENILQIGPDSSPIVTFSNNSITEIGGIFSTDCIGNQLPWDEFEATVQYGNPDAPNYESPGVELRTLPYGTPVKWTYDSSRVVRLYLSGVDRVSKYLYHISAISGVGLLDGVTHPGGLYNRALFSSIVAEIIGNLFDYEVSIELGSLEVIGWLPYDNARSNLHRLLFALGAAIRKSDDGVLRFGFLSEGEPAEVSDGRVAYGGSVEYMAPATAAEITEHTYFVGDYDETVSLFDNTAAGSDAADHTLVVFTQTGPVHSLSASGSLTINSSGVNYAVVSGVGVLSGKLYSHATRIVSRSNLSTNAANIKRVTDNGLISILNSLNVAKRVLSYYSSAKTVRNKIRLENERSGDCVELSDPYNEATKGYLQEMRLSASTALFADCEIIADYKPTGQGNNISTVVLITKSQFWLVPEGVSKLTIVIGSGGDGGADGKPGQPGASGIGDDWLEHNSKVAYNIPPGDGGDGGEGGAKGLGGKILRFDLDVQENQFLAINIGIGGEANQKGTATTVIDGGVTYSSESGNHVDYGFVDVISGTRFGADGSDGTPGAKGGDGGSAEGEGAPGSNGDSTDNYMGGTPAAGAIIFGVGILHGGFQPYTVLGGPGGSGASTESSGKDAPRIICSHGSDSHQRKSWWQGESKAPDGVDGKSKSASGGYGQGGNGGDGGSGGAGSGGYRNVPFGEGDAYTLTLRVKSPGGKEGAGGKGGAGGPGWCLIYY